MVENIKLVILACWNTAKGLVVKDGKTDISSSKFWYGGAAAAIITTYTWDAFRTGYTTEKMLALAGVFIVRVGMTQYKDIKKGGAPDGTAGPQKPADATAQG